MDEGRVTIASGDRRPASAAAQPRGVHHLVLCTDLGTGPGNRGNPPYENLRHYFFDMGNDSLLAFFEIPKGEQPAGNRNAIGAMQHCAFVVPAARFAALERHLQAQGVAYNGPVEQAPGMFGIYFYDPNGIRLEFACQPAQGEGQEIIRHFTQTKAQASAELATLPGATPDWIAKRMAAMPD
jgi:catechol 2,3-dioxygenase-like lactoylglutathione lyase family enzyme